MTFDLHIHPLNHKYYHQSAIDYVSVILDEEDKACIRAVVDWCCHVRKLDAISLTDHDMLQAGLYARDYVAQSNLSIRIVPGAECEVCDPQSQRHTQPIHLLCLGIETLPRYSWRTSVSEMISMVHKQGGIVILSHPVYYPQTFYRYCHLLDGYEYKNGEAGVFEDGKQFLSTRICDCKPYCNSDFHYEGVLPSVASPRLLHNMLGNDWI